MAWKVEYKIGVLKDVARFDRVVQRRLKKFIEELAASDNPRLKGKAKQGGDGLWLYRVRIPRHSATRSTRIRPGQSERSDARFSG